MNSCLGYFSEISVILHFLLDINQMIVLQTYIMITISLFLMKQYVDHLACLFYSPNCSKTWSVHCCLRYAIIIRLLFIFIFMIINIIIIEQFDVMFTNLFTILQVIAV